MDIDELLKLLPEPKDCINFTIERTDKLSIYDCKLGGMPYFPKNMKYPVSKTTKQPLRLLVQLNFEKMPYIPNFPKKGILQIYIGADDCYGFNFNDILRQDDFRIIYHKNIIKDKSRLLKEITLPEIDPYDMPIVGTYKLLPDLPFKKMVTMSDYHFTNAINDYKDIDKIYDLYNEYCNQYNHNVAYIGGYPVFAQTDPREYQVDLQDKDTVLFALDSIRTKDIDIMWGDCGTGMFLISEEDLRNLDFSNVIYNYDCC